MAEKRVSDERFRALWLQRPLLTVEEIAAQTGLRVYSLHRRARDMGLPLRNALRTADHNEGLREMLEPLWMDPSLSNAEVARRAGLHITHMCKRAREFGFPRRNEIMRAAREGRAPEARHATPAADDGAAAPEALPEGIGRDLADALRASGGTYAGLGRVALKFGLTRVQVLQRWHRLRAFERLPVLRQERAHG